MSKRLFHLLLEVPSSMVRATRELISRGLSHTPLASALGSSPKKPLSPNTGGGSSLPAWFICGKCKHLRNTVQGRKLCWGCDTKGGKNFQEDKLS